MPEIKITDKRMFTADGELREEFEDFESMDDAPDEEEAAPTPAPDAAPAPDLSAAAPVAPPPTPDPAPSPTPEPAARVDLPPEEASPYGTPTFLDLLAMLAEPIAIYLGDAPMPGGESAENLDLARMHIDLLEVLHQKTAGNLTSQEVTIIDDLLYRLRMRYVQKRG